MSKATLLAVIIALVLGWWAGKAVSDRLIAQVLPRRPGVVFVPQTIEMPTLETKALPLK